MKSQHSEVFYYAIAVYAVAAIAIIATPDPAGHKQTANAMHKQAPPAELLNVMPLNVMPVHAQRPAADAPSLAIIPAKL